MVKSLKHSIAILLAVLLSLLLVACGDKTEENENEKESKKNTSKTEMVYSDEYLNKHMPKEYRISYKIVTSDGDSKDQTSTVTLSKSNKGILLNIDGAQQLFIKSDKGYKMYSYDEDAGTWTDMSTIYNEKGFLSEADVNNIVTVYTNYMGYYSALRDEMKYDGKEEICGRKCEKYKYKGGIPGYNAKYDIYIDKETGVCLKYTIAVKAEGEKANLNFEATEFVTEGIEIPEVS